MLNIPFEDLLKVIDELSDEQKLIISEHLAESAVAGADAKPKKSRKLDLHPGAFQTRSSEASEKAKLRTPNLGAGTVWMSDDFDDPLPDEFWLGEDA
jgi:hypothetical protein